MTTQTKPITVLGKTFNSEDERREYFREELRKKLPELKKMEGFPIGEDDDIINLSDPPYYTACPNPWLNGFITEWEEEKKELEKQGKRTPDFEVNEPYPLGIKAGKNHSIYNAHSYHTKVPHEITTRFLLYYSQPGDIVIDTFSGTGMTGVGGSYCQSMESDFEHKFQSDLKAINRSITKGKRNVVNIDLSSIASHISSVYNRNADLETLQEEYTEILNKLKGYDHYYETKHSNSRKGRIRYTVYSQLYNCNNCNEHFDYYSAAYEEGVQLRTLITCPKCGFGEKKSRLKPVFETKTDCKGEVVKQVVHKPIMLNYKVGTSRHEKVLDNDDKEILGTIKMPWTAEIPDDLMIDGVETKRNEKYGLTKTHHFYTNRTLFFISSFIHECKTKEQKGTLLFLLTAILPKLTKLNRYMPQHGSRALVGPMANTLYLPPLYVENNFIDQMEFQFKKILIALRFSRAQLVSQQSATELINIEDCTIDYAFVDPPFGSNIMYSELNNLSESWIKVLTNNNEEAIESKGQNKSKFDYERLMTKSFSELFRVLKKGSWMTVEFSNTSAAIWNIIQNGLSRAGFVIANVDDLNKTRGGLHAMLGPVAVKQDLVISCYKPSSDFDEKFKQHQQTDVAVWDFVEEHLNHLPIHLKQGNSTTAIVERSPKILFDRIIAFYVQKGLPVPIDAGKFQKGLRERFVERDGMFFTQEQVQIYDKKKSENPEFVQLSLLVSSEQDGVLWLKSALKEKPMKYQDINPLWMQALAGMRKGDVIPELMTILEENFLKDGQGRWYAPDPENEIDLEQLRTKRLLKQFDEYRTEAAKPRGKIKEARVEALRAGFKQCYQDKDFKTIVQVGDRIPNNLLMEDEVLLQFYDIASTRI